MKTAKKFGSMCRSFSRIGSNLLGKRISVLKAEGNEIGYTSKDGRIYLAEEHEIYPKDEDAKYLFLYGVFCHEMGHQFFTDFTATAYFCQKYKSPIVQKMCADMLNIIEDPAIEYHLTKKLTGNLIKGLLFSKKWIWEHSHPIDLAMGPYEQFATALIHFGDLGYVIGKWTFPEAEKCYYELLPKIDKAITETDAFARTQIEYEIFDEAAHRLIPNLDELNEIIPIPIKDFSHSTGGLPSDSFFDYDEDSDLNDNENASPLEKAMRNRKKSVEQANKKPEKRISGDTKDNSTKNDTSSISDKNNNSAQQNNENSNESDEENKEKESGMDSSSDFNESEDTQNDNELTLFDFDYSNPEPEDGENEIEFEDLDLDLSSIEVDTSIVDELIEDDRQTQLDTKAELHETNIDYDSISLDSKYWSSKKVKCINQIIRSTNPSDKVISVYNAIVDRYRSIISIATNRIKRAIATNAESVDYRTSGKISFKRLTSCRQTSRVFFKKTQPNKADMALILVLDMSGSMNGQKIDSVREATICFAEICEKIGVPLYIMGFNEGVSVIHHHHFLRWKNNKSLRLALMNIRSGGFNFDGYAIRFSSELLKKRPEENKVMMVLSDGDPSSTYYASEDIGIADVRSAVAEVNKKGMICHGIFLNPEAAASEQHKAMYGRNMTNCTNVEDVFYEFVKILQKNIKNDI